MPSRLPLVSSLPCINVNHIDRIVILIAAALLVEKTDITSADQAKAVQEDTKQRVSFGVSVIDAVVTDEQPTKTRSSLPRIATPYNKTPLPAESEEEDEEDEEEPSAPALSLFDQRGDQRDVDTQTDKSLGQLKREIKAVIQAKPAIAKKVERAEADSLAELMSNKMVLNGVPKASGESRRCGHPGNFVSGEPRNSD